MNHRRGTGLLTMGAIAAAMLAGCGSSNSSPANSSTTARITTLDAATTSIDYTFVGPSTAPGSHNEYRILVARGTATITSGGYGTVAGSTKPQHTATAPVDAARWQRVEAKVDALPTSSQSNDRGCTGGSSYRVTITTGAQPVKQAQAYACGSDFDKQSAPFTDFIAPITELFDMKTLTGN